MSQRELDTDLSFMRIAVALARDGVENGFGGPFGAVIARGRTLIGQGCNQVLTSKDPTAHAEIIAIRDATRRLESFHLTGCTLYATCEPCPMCLAATYWARIGLVVYSLTRADAAAMGFSDAAIYEELTRPMKRRTVQLKQRGRQQALALRKLWQSKPNRKLY